MGLNILLPLIFTSLTLQLASGQGNAISCTAGKFTKCAAAKVTCHFNQDVKQNKKNFNVVQYPYKQGVSSSDAGNYVLVCNWGEGESLECKVEEGYTFDKQVSDSLTLGIPDVKSSVGGVYVCQLVPDGGIPLETCKLDVQDASSAAGGSCPSLTCPETSANEGIHIAVLICVVLVLVLVVVLIIVITVAIYIKLNYRFEKKTSGNAAAGAHNSGTCCGLTLTRLSDDTESAAPGRSRKRSTEATPGNPQEAAALLNNKGEASTYKEDHFVEPSRLQKLPASAKELPTPVTRQDQKAKDVTKPKAGQAGNNPAPTNGQGVEDDGDGHPHTSSGPTGNESFEDIQGEETQGEGEHKSRPRATALSMSPPRTSSTDKGAQNIAEQLEDYKSDTWTVEQVCQWLEQEGLEKHVPVFKKEKVDGKRLLTFSTSTGLWWLGMPWGNRQDLLGKINKLRTPVKKRNNVGQNAGQKDLQTRATENVSAV